MEKIERDTFWYALYGRELRVILDHLENFKVDNREDMLDREEAIRRLQRIMVRNQCKRL